MPDRTLEGWDRADLARLAVAVLTDAVRAADEGNPAARAFFLGQRTARIRDLWCAPLGLDPDAVREAVARLLALPAAERRARLAALRNVPLADPANDRPTDWFPGAAPATDRPEIHRDD